MLQAATKTCKLTNTQDIHRESGASDQIMAHIGGPAECYVGPDCLDQVND